MDAKDSLIGWTGGTMKFGRYQVGLGAVLLDNCGGHGDLPSFDGAEYVELPPNTTPRYQPLDQGLISKPEIRYRALLLRETIDILHRLQGSDHGFRSNSARGRYALRESQVPHILDAINLMDRSWNDVSVCDVINC